MVEVHEGLEPRLARRAEELVIPRRAPGVDIAVRVEQAAPLDRRAEAVEPEPLEDGKVLLVPVHEIVAHVGAHALVERPDVLVGPGVPEVLELAAYVPASLRLRTGHRRPEEEVLGQGQFCHDASFSSLVLRGSLSRFID